MSTTHNTKGQFEKWAATARGAELAATHCEAARLHYAGKMNAAQYQQRKAGLLAAAIEAGVEAEYQAALTKQLGNDFDPGLAGESMRLLEKYRARVEGDFRSAVLEANAAQQAAKESLQRLEAANSSRDNLESLLNQIAAALDGLVRS